MTTVKTSWFVLLLSCAGLLAHAQTGSFGPLPSTPTDTNRDETLRRALHGSKPLSNAPAPATVAAPDTNAVPPVTTAVAPPVVIPAAQPNATAATPTNRPAPVFPLPGRGIVPGSRTNLPAGVPPQAAAPGETLIAITPPSSTNAAPEETLPAGTINFPATDLNQVLQIYAELVGRTVLRPTTLPAPTITLKTQTPLTRREAIQAFDAVLALNGITVIPVGEKFVKVVGTPQAGQVGAPFSKETADQLPDMGSFVTHIVQTTYVKPSDLVQPLTPFASAGLQNGILPIDPSQILVLRDFSENVKRMLEMIKKIDVAVPSEYISEVIPIKYALSSDIASALNSLSTGGGGTTVGAGGAGATTGGAMGGRGGFGASRMGGMGGMGGQYGRSGMGTGYQQGYGGMTTPYGTQGTAGGLGGAQQPGSSFTDRLRNIIQKASVSGEIQVLGQTKIIADERTNSLLIFASREDMKMIKDIVAKLDVVLAQVLIEAVIIEVSLSDSFNFGVSYVQKSPSGNNYLSGIGAINNNNILTKGNFNVLGVGTNANVQQGFSYLTSLGNDLDVSVTALAANGRGRILQRPRIQTSHAVPATLFVGESRPYPQGSYYGGGSFGGYSTIQQLQIGVSLSVTPLINPDGLVVMDINQHIESFKENVTIQGVGDVPVTSSKDATAKVAVRDHDTIMLGGLIEDTKNSNNSGVPFLKDVPLLGYLFRSTAKSSTRNELIVLIRPTVLPTPEVAALTARAEKDKMPGVRSLEDEIQKDDAERLRSANELRKKQREAAGQQ